MAERKGTKALELWCKRLVNGHPGVNIENMSTSWRNGLAFCALIHHFRPDLIDFASLKPEDVYYNNELAFRTAETHLGIPALLDPEDMVDHEVPDRLSLLTYLSQFYQRLGSSGTPKKSSSSIEEEMVTPTPAPRKKIPDLASQKIGKSGYEPCTVCSLPVYLAQRLLVSHRLYHRRCFRCAECNAQLSPTSCYENSTGTEFCCETCNNIEANIFCEKGNDVRTSIGMYEDVFNKTKPRLVDESKNIEKEINSTDVLPTITPISERLTHFEREAKSISDDDSNISPTYLLRTRATNIEKRNFLLSNLADDNPDIPSSLDCSTGSVASHSSLVKSRISIFENDDKVLKNDTETDFSLVHQSSPKTSQRMDSNIDEFVMNDIATKLHHTENRDKSDSSCKVEEISDVVAKESRLIVPNAKSINDYDYKIEFDDGVASEPKHDEEYSKLSKSLSDRRLDVAKEENANKTIVEDTVEPLVSDLKKMGLKDSEDESLETNEKVGKQEEVPTDPKETLNKEKDDLLAEKTILKIKELDLLEVKDVLKGDSTEHKGEKKVLEEETEGIKEENEYLREEKAILREEKGDKTEHKEDSNKKKERPNKETHLIHDDVDVLKEKNPGEKVEKQKKDKRYPDDLNPFTDDEEEEDDPMEKCVEKKHESTNPFGSSDEEDAEDEVPRVKKLSSSTLNPFWSDGEEPSSDEDVTHVTKTNNKPNKMSPRSYMTASTPTLSMVSPRRKKAMAPKPPPPPRPPAITVHEAPPQLTEIVNSHSKYTDDGCSVSSFSSHCSTVCSDTKSIGLSPKPRKKRPAPPAPASLHTSLSSNHQQEHIASHNKTLDSYFDNEDEKAGRWRRHKGPAPGLPLPGRRIVRTELSLPQIDTELEHLETQHQGLEKQGVLLEQMIREKCEGEHSVDVPQEEVEDLVIQLCELVNEKNDLFRKQAELMYICRQQRLEQEQADIEHEIRVIQSRPAVDRTDTEKAREEELVLRLLAVVRLRDRHVQQLDQERRREAAEDRAIATSIAQRRAHRDMKQKSQSLQSLDVSPKKKNKVKDRVKKQLKKAKELTTGYKKKEEPKTEETSGKTSKGEKNKWFA